MSDTQTALEWIVEQACGHVSRWVYAGDREDFAALPSTQQNVPCKGAPIVGWGEWCHQCRDIVPVTRTSPDLPEGDSDDVKQPPAWGECEYHGRIEPKDLEFVESPTGDYWRHWPGDGYQCPVAPRYLPITGAAE